MITPAHSDQPAMVPIGGEHQQRRRYDQLVGDGIEHAPDGALLLPGARQIAVEEIGDAGGDEDPHGDPAAPIAGDEEAGDERGDGEDAAIGEEVRQAAEAAARGASPGAAKPCCAMSDCPAHVSYPRSWK